MEVSLKNEFLILDLLFKNPEGLDSFDPYRGREDWRNVMSRLANSGFVDDTDIPTFRISKPKGIEEYIRLLHEVNGETFKEDLQREYLTTAIAYFESGHKGKGIEKILGLIAAASSIS